MKRAFLYMMLLTSLLFISCSIGVDLEPDPQEEPPQKVKENVMENISDTEEEMILNTDNK